VWSDDEGDNLDALLSQKLVKKQLPQGKSAYRNMAPRTTNAAMKKSGNVKDYLQQHKEIVDQALDFMKTDNRITIDSANKAKRDLKTMEQDYKDKRDNVWDTYHFDTYYRNPNSYHLSSQSQINIPMYSKPSNTFKLPEINTHRQVSEQRSVPEISVEDAQIIDLLNKKEVIQKEVSDL
jgi:hypothetical protein